MKGGFDLQFTTGNYHITTTPKAEWSIVRDIDDTLADMRHHRRITDWRQSARSSLAVEAGLKDFEVIAIILYTGPMVSSTKLLRSNVYE